MPTYEYRCTGCGHQFEEFQSMSADPLVKCPSCGNNTLKRMLGGGAGMIFKGQGFYQTDYKSSSSSSTPGTKPAPKKETKPNKPSTPPKTDKP